MKITIRPFLWATPLVIGLTACGSSEPTKNDPVEGSDLVKTSAGYSELSDGQGGINYEAVAITSAMGFDKERSLEAFGNTLYRHLREQPNASRSGAPAPLHSSDNMELAHEYALTEVNFNEPENSKLVTDLAIYRKNCVSKCSDDAKIMLSAINKWKREIQSMLYIAPRSIAESEKVSDADIESWIEADKYTLPQNQLKYMVYTSIHQMHNSGASSDELNIARAGLSKALNSVARWAPKIVNPMDVNNKGVLYRFDIRDYWGWNKGVTKLLFGGSDDDLAFGQNKRDYLGQAVSSTVQDEEYGFTQNVTQDPKLALLIWQRVLHGSVEDQRQSGNAAADITGFHGPLSKNAAGEYIQADELEWAEATQLIYTLTRPSVYASIMMIPMHADQLEDELGVDKSKGIDSYDYFVTFDALPVDSQFAFKAKRKDGGFYWKTFEIFTGQLEDGDRNIYDIYEEGGADIRFPFWANPIPKFVDPNLDQEDEAGSLSFIATLAQTGDFSGFSSGDTEGCDEQPGAVNGFGHCRHYTGTGGLQQSESSIIWDLPNGLNGYMRAGGFNQRRIEGFINVIRDPRLYPEAGDNITSQTGFSFDLGDTKANAASPRLNASSSMISLYPDGLNRTPNDLRDWLDSDQERLPKGIYGADNWIDDKKVTARVKTLYPAAAESKKFIEQSRKTFLASMAKIKQGMVIGVNKNIYLEPVTWVIEYRQKMLTSSDDTPVDSGPVVDPKPIGTDPNVDPNIDPDDYITTPTPAIVPNPTLADGELINVDHGFSTISNGTGGINYEAVAITPEMGFDKAASLIAFTETLYPYLRGLPNVSPSGAPAPLHSSDDIELAHEYALTQVYFNKPEASKLVTDLSIYRRGCVTKCAKDAIAMLAEIKQWKARIKESIYQTPRSIAESDKISDADIESWIAADQKTIAANQLQYMVYTSMHQLHNDGATADELNLARVGLSKALNSVARWAPAIVNPVNVGKGLLYRFDIRNYWGWNKGVTKLLFGGSDDDMAFGQNKKTYLGVPISREETKRYNYTDSITQDPHLARLIWQRILHGNVEGASTNGNINPNIDGFYGRRSSNAAGDYIKASDLTWVETTQLIYTLTRPDVYVSAMMIPMYADQLEAELGVDNSRGMDSYDYFVTFDALSIDAQFAFKAKREDNGFYWKTFEVFTGQLSGGDRNIFDAYKEGGDDIRFPFWANPIPKFVDPAINQGGSAGTWSFIATLAQSGSFAGFTPPDTEGCDTQPGSIAGFGFCRHYTGTGGAQQASSSIIWDLPNGLNGYMRLGGYNQRRLDEFVNVIRDPRLLPDADDNITTQTGYSYTNGTEGFRSGDPRLNSSSSMMHLYPDGLNRTRNDLRDWLDNDQDRLPKGTYGVDGWINDEATVARVKELYPTTEESQSSIEDTRKTFLNAMAIIKQGMMKGADKNVYVEPVIWAVEHAQRVKYRYPQTSSN